MGPVPVSHNLEEMESTVPPVRVYTLLKRRVATALTALYLNNVGLGVEKATSVSLESVLINLLATTTRFAALT